MNKIFYIIFFAVLAIFVLLSLDDTKTQPATQVANQPSKSVEVKYRQDSVNTNKPSFECVDTSKSSMVTSACFDEQNSYLILGINGTNYNYCNLPASVWSQFKSASSFGTYYNKYIKGNFDCRSGGVPSY